MAQIIERAKADAIAVNDAWRVVKSAARLYACDAAWWNFHNGCPEYEGSRWSVLGPDNDTRAVAKAYGINLINGMHGEGFSTKPGTIHYGHNSGFQAVNLAIQLGAKRIVLVGFDMQAKGGKRHFFGDHPAGLRNTSNYAAFVKAFEDAAKQMPDGVEIVNATPDSALTCFPKVELDVYIAAH